MSPEIRVAPLLVWMIVVAGGAGCGDEASCESCVGTGGGSTSATTGSGGTGAGGAPCTGTKGTLAGIVYRWAPPGDPLSELAPEAFVLLRETPDVPPTYAMADSEAHYEVEIEAGDWIVGAEDGTGCYSDEPITVTVDACETTTADLVMDLCTG